MKFLLLLALLPAIVLSAPPHKLARHNKAPTSTEATHTEAPAPAVEPAAEESTPTEAASSANESSSDAPPESAAAPEYEPVAAVSETPAAVAESETPAPTVSEEPQSPAETSETPVASTEASNEPQTQDETSETAASTVAPAAPAAETEKPTSDADSSSSSSESDESTSKTPTPADSTSSESSEETAPAATGEDLKPVQQLQEPVVATLVPTGAEAKIDGVTVKFALQATWVVEKMRRRGYLVRITNNSEKDVCGVTFVNNVETTDIYNLLIADDGSLTTKHLHLAPGATAPQFGYVSSARSKPTILAVTYC